MIRNVQIKVASTKNNLPNLEAALKLLQKKQVLVGVPEQKDARNDDAISNAALLYLNDTGSPSQNIPARPTLQPGVEDAKPKIIPHLRAIGQQTLENPSPVDIERGLSAVGQIASNSVKARINAGPPPPLKPATIKARKRRGHASEKPLVETAQMRNAVTSAVREK